MRKTQQFLLSGFIVLASGVIMLAQGPGGAPGGGGRGPGGGGGGKGRGPAGPALSITSSAFADGAEVPAANAGAQGGGNMSPDFEFHWFMGTMPADPPAALKSYAIVFHDIENASNKGPVDTLHWSAFNIPGDAKGLPAGLGPGKLADGTVNGPGIRGRGANPGAYFGPGAGPGPWHHYIFEFYALDAKLDLPDSPLPTRDELMKAMEGHVIGKAAYTGRFHGLPAKQ